MVKKMLWVGQLKNKCWVIKWLNSIFFFTIIFYTETMQSLLNIYNIIKPFLERVLCNCYCLQKKINFR